MSKPYQHLLIDLKQDTTESKRLIPNVCSQQQPNDKQLKGGNLTTCNIQFVKPCTVIYSKCTNDKLSKQARVYRQQRDSDVFQLAIGRGLARFCELLSKV